MSLSGHSTTLPGSDNSCLLLRVSGHVQGVGFRPHVYRLAQRMGLAGWVRNALGQVEITVQGAQPLLAEFVRALIQDAPPLARPSLDSQQTLDCQVFTGFHILASESGAAPRVFIPPDYFCCDECIKDVHTPGNRRYRYPFTNCTQCGPRYTLIRALPYDRANTSMAAFPLCERCNEEYLNPLDRRFHAEPVACPDCGPSISFALAGQAPVSGEEALAKAVAALASGKILAVKGVGGYHLMCDARDEQAVQRLRQRKRRPDKPLAVMFPQSGKDGLDALRERVSLEPVTAAAVAGPERPIVLVPRRARCDLAPGVAPGLSEVGVFLPYSPLHHLLLSDFGGPLVATSGNLSGEPVLTTVAEAESGLGKVADGFMHHDRPIVRPADDPVWRFIDGRLRPMRLGRGCTPLEMNLPGRLQQPVLALGGQMKNTLALAWDDRLVISPHIGEMASARSLQVFEQVASDLQSLYGVEARRLLVDAHPAYTTHRWARARGLPLTPCFHHHAHASALALDNNYLERCLVFAWDGVGYGEDGSLWGGEAFLGRPGQWRRVASFRRFRLPGGELAARSPWRSAAGLCWEAGISWAGSPAPELVRQAWERGLNSPYTSAVGRLFDGAAGLLGLHETSFEGQGPMQLEARSTACGDFVDMPLLPGEGGVLRADWEPLVRRLLAGDAGVVEAASLLHESLARCLVKQAQVLCSDQGIQVVGLCGGVFQNALLAARCRTLLEECGFHVLQARNIPCNDAGISAGQVMQALGST
jgi:hydrogenase maturation protein HypF